MKGRSIVVSVDDGHAPRDGFNFVEGDRLVRVWLCGAGSARGIGYVDAKSPIRTMLRTAYCVVPLLIGKGVGTQRVRVLDEGVPGGPQEGDHIDSVCADEIFCQLVGPLF